MSVAYQDEFSTLHLGDCVDVMRSLPAESIDAIVTSPPYAEQRKSTYGGIPEKDYPEWSVRWMTEARRLLKPDGSVIINIRPHLRNGIISDYVLRTRLALREDGWAELEEMIWNKVSGIPLGSRHRPRRSWESLLWYGKHGRAWSNPKGAGAESTWKPSTGGRRGPHIVQADVARERTQIARVPDVVTMSTKFNSPSDGLNDHPAPYPWQLAEWCGKLICPPGGTILDPFSGSQSTGVAAIWNGWQYVGIELFPEYIGPGAERLARTTEEQR